MKDADPNPTTTSAFQRRTFLKTLAVAGLAGTAFSRALGVLAADQPRVTTKMIRQAEWIAGIELDDEKRKLMEAGVEDLVKNFATLREIPLDNSVAPVLQFNPSPGKAAEGHPAEIKVRPIQRDTSERPAAADDIAFAPVGQIAAWIRSGKISSVELTKLYLDRLRTFDPELHCVITLTENLALEQAGRADREIASGRYRGPLHGIPWGAKDLLAVPGYPTTWGATPYKEQMRQDKATVVTRLEEAGAVLVAKLSVGALAWGDVWFDAMTRNPWNTEQGSSGSSAGPAAATSAGLVGFAIGTETWGSIISPCTRCGVTGLRPTFGRVSRHGAMALSWSMDKIGPITRSVEDCALVFGAIQGTDGLDPTVVNRPFEWPARRDPRELRVGYLEALFEEDRAEGVENEAFQARLKEWQAMDTKSLDVLRSIGIKLIPMAIPDDYSVSALSLILTAEAAAAFDELTRSGQDQSLVRQVEQAWPNVFRQGQMIPAVEYVRANRIRGLLMKETEKALASVDVLVHPSYGGNVLLRTNLTGHPSVVVPNGFFSDSGTPASITFTGQLHGETELLAVAHAYQEATDFHLKRPPLGDA